MMKLVYLSPVHWSSYEQRPHFMVRYLLSKGVDSVLWINPVPLRLPEFADFTKRRGAYDQKTISNPRISVVNLRSFPVEPLPLLNSVNNLFWRDLYRRVFEFTKGSKFIVGIGKPSRLALEILNRFEDAAWSFYDAMDDFPEFYKGVSRLSVCKWEGLLASKVKTIIASSSFLHEKFSKVHGRKSILVQNACKSPDSSLQTRHIYDRPIIGYIGTVGKWFDWDTLREMALINADCDFYIIGPMFKDPGTDLPENITIHLPCAHSETISYMSKFSIGLIPFFDTPLTRGVDPVKFYEYRAMGLPVMTTPFGEMRLRTRKDRVFLIKKNHYKDSVRDALEALPDISAEETLNFRNDNNWEKRFSLIGRIVSHNLSEG